MTVTLNDSARIDSRETTWRGRYVDGQRARSRHVIVVPGTDALRITQDDGPVLHWVYDEIRLTQGTYGGEHIRLEHTAAPSAALILTDPRFLAALKVRAPRLVPAIRDPTRHALRLKFTILAGLVTVLIAGVLFRWGVPGLASLVTPYVPVSWEQQLGEQVVQYLVPQEAQCLDPSRTKILDALVAQVAAGAPGNPYGSIHLYVVDEPVVNAFAAPGGYVVIYRGLLEKTETPEQLAGVVAHELQHVFKRHTTRAMLEQASTGLLLAAVSGDLTGAATLALDSARTLGALRYSRAHEEEADEEGLKTLLAAGIDPQGMIDFFRILNKDRGGETGLIRYLSTHPTHDDRIQALSRLADGFHRQGRTLFPGLDWQSIRNACRSGAPQSSGSGL